MGFKLPFMRKPTGSNVVLTLTPLGKTKAEQFSMPGPKGDIIIALNDSGPSTLSEVGSAIGMPVDRVKSVAKALIDSGYVRTMDSGG